MARLIVLTGGWFRMCIMGDKICFRDFKKYQDLLDPDNDLRADLAIDLAAELMVVEFAHRLISCFYEVRGAFGRLL